MSLYKVPTLHISRDCCFIFSCKDLDLQCTDPEYNPKVFVLGKFGEDWMNSVQVKEQTDTPWTPSRCKTTTGYQKKSKHTNSFWFAPVTLYSTFIFAELDSSLSLSSISSEGFFSLSSKSLRSCSCVSCNILFPSFLNLSICKKQQTNCSKITFKKHIKCQTPTNH